MNSVTTLASSIFPDTDVFPLASANGLNPNGGTIIIDRFDANGNHSPASQEVVFYDEIIDGYIVGAKRGGAGTTAQSHLSGAIVEDASNLWTNLIKPSPKEDLAHDVERVLGGFL